MAYYLLSAEAGFSAAHTLPGVDMCERMHGHNWRVQVTARVDGESLDDNGMGVDFRALADMVRAAVGEFEHRYLNELDAFADRRPTAECIAQVIYERVAERLAVTAPAARLTEVALWEMPEFRVVYRES